MEERVVDSEFSSVATCVDNGVAPTPVDAVGCGDGDGRVGSGYWMSGIGSCGTGWTSSGGNWNNDGSKMGRGDIVRGGGVTDARTLLLAVPVGTLRARCCIVRGSRTGEEGVARHWEVDWRSKGYVKPG